MSTETGFKFLKTMIRVADLDRSIEFYTRLLGMTLLRKRDVISGRFTLVFLGYGDETQNTVIELTHNWDQTDAYDVGTGFGYLALGVPDIYVACEKLEGLGVKLLRPPGPMKESGSVIAFIADPDGYRIELVEKQEMRAN